jgi:hypothetical protein
MEDPGERFACHEADLVDVVQNGIDGAASPTKLLG